MVAGEVALEIRVLHRHGKGIREIARETGSARNTVRRYLRDESAERYKPRPPRLTKLDPFKDYVVERLRSAAPGLPSLPAVRPCDHSLLIQSEVIAPRRRYGQDHHSQQGRSAFILTPKIVRR